jgi:hypothetical protein
VRRGVSDRNKLSRDAPTAVRAQPQLAKTPKRWIPAASLSLADRTGPAPAPGRVVRTLHEWVAVGKAGCHGLHPEIGLNENPRISIGRYSNPAGLFRPHRCPFYFKPKCARQGFGFQLRLCTSVPNADKIQDTPHFPFARDAQLYCVTPERRNRCVNTIRNPLKPRVGLFRLP